MGRARTPTEILEARGAIYRNPQRLEARKGEPKDERPLGEPPNHLDREEKAAWRELAQTAPDGVLRYRDRWWVERAVCLMVLVRTSRGRANASQESLLQGYLAKLGMNPSDNSKVKASREESKPDDTLSRLLSPTLKPQ